MVEYRSRWKHLKTDGTYKVVAVGTYTVDPLHTVVVYMSEKDGSVWVRPETEFLDGRFERLNA